MPFTLLFGFWLPLYNNQPKKGPPYCDVVTGLLSSDVFMWNAAQERDAPDCAAWVRRVVCKRRRRLLCPEACGRWGAGFVNIAHMNSTSRDFDVLHLGLGFVIVYTNPKRAPRENISSCCFAEGVDKIFNLQGSISLGLGFRV